MFAREREARRQESPVRRFRTTARRVIHAQLVFMCVCVCACVCDREIETSFCVREIERDLCVCVRESERPVCVCQRERERHKARDIDQCLCV